MRLVVLAKSPVPGRCKTRLHSDFTPSQAAEIARASLRDTLECVRAVPGVRCELVLEGQPESWMRPGMKIRPQVKGSLEARINAALQAESGPALLIGMDTPQVTPELLATSCMALNEVDAVLGLATDGGWWALGLRNAPLHAYVVDDIPTSTSATGNLQRQRLVDDQLTFADLPVLRDVDTPEDARAVATLVPGGRFGRLITSLTAAA